MIEQYGLAVVDAQVFSRQPSESDCMGVGYITITVETDVNVP